MALRVIAAFLVLLAAGYCQPAAHPASAPVTLAVYLAIPCSSPGGAGPPLKLAGVEPGLCLQPKPFLTHQDVQSAELHKRAGRPPVIFLTFHEAAAVRELQVTLKNIGSRVVIALNGRVVSAPKIPGASRFLYIDTQYPEQQVEKLVEALNRQAGARR